MGTISCSTLHHQHFKRLKKKTHQHVVQQELIEQGRVALFECAQIDVSLERARLVSQLLETSLAVVCTVELGRKTLAIDSHEYCTEKSEGGG